MLYYPVEDALNLLDEMIEDHIITRSEYTITDEEFGDDYWEVVVHDWQKLVRKANALYTPTHFSRFFENLFGANEC